MRIVATSPAAVISLPAGIRLREPAIRRLGLAEYRPTYEAMRRFTEDRDAATADELWVLEHPAIYTTGLAGRAEHYPDRSTIPVERVDRGGQITYHGPGQAIVYALVDLARRGLSVRAMVALLEQAVIDTLAARGLDANRTSGAPGVYVKGAKIAALGLRVRRGCCYHGVALNVNMDLAPFSAIDPCGHPGLEVTQTSALGVAPGAGELGQALARRIARLLER
ncbi:MAG: lipoyl(octanoyl) transferase LipB [Burkholderiales bacterium]